MSREHPTENQENLILDQENQHFSHLLQFTNHPCFIFPAEQEKTGDSEMPSVLWRQ